jgi:peptidoglycan/xylan/chitin deacetylase (PgdA/CDA1 family)
MFPHGLLFHHFHDSTHGKGQGSISAEKFWEIIEFVGKERLLSADDWMVRARDGKLKETDLCLTFDDNLRCQFDIALPVLEAHNLTAFWFVYTSPLAGIIEKVELYRYFRSNYIDDVDDFYEAFYAQLKDTPLKKKMNTALSEIDIENYLADKNFYTKADRKFRFIRNTVLSTADYNKIMDDMIASSNLPLEAIIKHLWMDENCLKTLHNNSHVIGLHSHSHPTGLGDLAYADQEREYGENAATIENILGSPPKTMSYPFGQYSVDTLSLAKTMNIELAFRADMNGPAHSNLEFPRENHATIMMRMKR